MAERDLIHSWQDGTEAVIFDLDGTLVDSMDFWTDIDIQYLARFGYAYDESLRSKIEGMSYTETAVYFKQTYDLPLTIDEIKADWIRLAIDKYRYEVPLKPYAREFLEYLKAHNIKTGIASSNVIDMVEACLTSLSVRNLFDVVTTACEVKKGKPAPDVYLHVAAKLRVKPENCIVFEDIPAGIMAGKNAGMKVIAVYDAFSESLEDEKKALADAFIRDFSELSFK